jgi:hypothetical protein
MFKLALSISVVLTLLAGGTAAWLAASRRGNVVVRLKVADRLAMAALMGAAAIYALLAMPRE